MAARVGPKIALIYDQNHLDPREIAIRERLSTIDPKKKIVFFAESRCLESEAFNQYSVELLSKDKSFSTATPCQLLIAHVIAGHNPNALQTILSTIYTDPYLKQLFVEKHYANYYPNEHGLTEKKNWSPLKEENMTEKQKNVIKNVNGLFQLLDRELPKKPSFKEKEVFFEGHTANATETMISNVELFDYNIFGPISEALAFIKIKKVEEKLAGSDTSKELSLSMINQLYGKDTNSVVEFSYELNQKYRTQFQVQKVIKIIEKVLKKEGPDTIFVVRNGCGHREMMTSLLLQHFTNGDIREIQLSQDDLPEVEQKIQEKFN